MNDIYSWRCSKILKTSFRGAPPVTDTHRDVIELTITRSAPDGVAQYRIWKDTADNATCVAVIQAPKTSFDHPEKLRISTHPGYNGSIHAPVYCLRFTWRPRPGVHRVADAGGAGPVWALVEGGGAGIYKNNVEDFNLLGVCDPFLMQYLVERITKYEK